MMKRTLLLCMALTACLMTSAKKHPAPVYIVAGQSNTDGRVPIADLPQNITRDSYQHCWWSYGSGTHSGNGEFERFWPKTYHPKRPEAWAYDAIVYYLLGQSLKGDFYVIKESLGGTAVSSSVKSTDGMYWDAHQHYLDANEAADKGGKSLLKAFCDNIDACIDQHLSKLKQGYDIKAFLWHQGESDKPMASSYQKNFKLVIDYVRQHLVEKTGRKEYAQLPVIIGSIPHASRGYSQKVEAAQKVLSDEDANLYWIDINDAPLQNDRLHLNAEGAEQLGRKVYEQLVSLGLAGKTKK